MEYRFKKEPVFNGGGVGEGREAQEIEGESFKDLFDAVLFFDLSKKVHSPLRR